MKDKPQKSASKECLTALEVLDDVVQQTQKTGGPTGTVGCHLYELALLALNRSDDKAALRVLSRSAGFYEYALRVGFRRMGNASFEALHNRVEKVLRQYGAEITPPTLDEKLAMEKKKQH